MKVPFSKHIEQLVHDEAFDVLSSYSIRFQGIQKHVEFIRREVDSQCYEETNILG